MPELTFKMPCLPSYDFHYDGRVYSPYRSKFIIPIVEKGITPYYRLLNESKKREWVSVKEVIQYGKHIKAVTDGFLQPKEPVRFRHVLKFIK